MTAHPKPDPRPVGRPVLKPGEGRIARVAWRTTADRKARAQQLADAAAVPLSTWLDALVDKAKPPR